jgi:hypothetical protein
LISYSAIHVTNKQSKSSAVVFDKTTELQKEEKVPLAETHHARISVDETRK